MEAFGCQEPFPGIDVTLLDRRLRMTPTERWEEHRRALALVTEIRRARARRLSETPTRYEDALPGSVEYKIYDRAIRIMGLDDLIQAKEAADRNKDRIHLKELRELKKRGGS